MKKDDEIRIVKYDRGKGARSLARERVGQPPPSKVITPKRLKKPKHKERYGQASETENDT
jgi:hypothetical protein